MTTPLRRTILAGLGLATAGNHRQYLGLRRALELDTDPALRARAARRAQRDAMAHVVDVDPDTLPAEGWGADELHDISLGVALVQERAGRDEHVLARRMEGWTFCEIGQEMKITGERVRQIETRAIRELREALTCSPPPRPSNAPTDQRTRRPERRLVSMLPPGRG